MEFRKRVCVRGGRRVGNTAFKKNGGNAAGEKPRVETPGENAVGAPEGSAAGGNAPLRFRDANMGESFGI